MLDELSRALGEKSRPLVWSLLETRLADFFLYDPDQNPADAILAWFTDADSVSYLINWTAATVPRLANPDSVEEASRPRASLRLAQVAFDLAGILPLPEFSSERENIVASLERASSDHVRWRNLAGVHQQEDYGWWVDPATTAEMSLLRLAPKSISWMLARLKEIMTILDYGDPMKDYCLYSYILCAAENNLSTKGKSTCVDTRRCETSFVEILYLAADEWVRRNPGLLHYTLHELESRPETNLLVQRIFERFRIELNSTAKVLFERFQHQWFSPGKYDGSYEDYLEERKAWASDFLSFLLSGGERLRAIPETKDFCAALGRIAEGDIHALSAFNPIGFFEDWAKHVDFEISEADRLFSLAGQMEWQYRFECLSTMCYQIVGQYFSAPRSRHSRYRKLLVRSLRLTCESYKQDCVSTGDLRWEWTKSLRRFLTLLLEIANHADLGEFSGQLLQEFLPLIVHRRHEAVDYLVSRILSIKEVSLQKKLYRYLFEADPQGLYDSPSLSAELSLEVAAESQNSDFEFWAESVLLVSSV